MTELDGRVHWERLDQSTFDRFVEPLLLRLHLLDDPKAEVDCLDGRGGDGGRDVDVSRQGRLTHIYQLKFFPEGFSGEWSKARKPQIRRSFDAAMTQLPKYWTLVVPRNPTVGERDFVKSLRNGHNVSVRIIGRAKLDEMMARFPDLLRWATREPLVETLRTIQLERAALPGSSDLQEAVKHLHQVADSRSPHWSVNHSYVNGIYTETLSPKHPLAQKFEPVGLRRAVIEIPAEARELGERARRVLRYGDNDELTLTSEHLKEIQFDAPSWSTLSEPPVSPVLTFLPRQSIRAMMQVELQIVDEDEIVLRAYAGETTYIGQGTDGATLRARIEGGITLRMTMDRSDGEQTAVPAGTITFSHSFTGLSASEAQVGLQFIQDMCGPHKIRSLFDGQFAQSLVSRQGSASAVKEAKDYVESEAAVLVDDLAVIERHLRMRFLVPETISVRDRLTIRVARLLLEGNAVIDPFIDGVNAELNDEIGPGLRAVIENGGGPLFADMPFALEILGRRVSLGIARLAISNAEVLDSESLVRALAAGTGSGAPFRARVKGAEGVKVFLPELVQPHVGELLVSPWGLAGIPEHPELRGTTDPPGPDVIEGSPSGSQPMP